MARQYGNHNLAVEIMICVLIAVSIWIASALFLVASTTWQNSLLERTGASKEGMVLNNDFIEYVLADENKLFSSESLNDAESSHMTDVRNVLRYLFAVLLSCIAVTAVLVSRIERGRAAIIVGAILSLFTIGIIFLLPFMQFFVGIHKVLFSQGNWIFPVDSMLIQTYSFNFWTAAFQAWIEIVIGAAALLIAGVHMLRE